MNFKKLPINRIDPLPSQLKKGRIVSFNTIQNTFDIELFDSSNIKGRNPYPITVNAPHSMFSNDGLFVGAIPAIGTPVVVGEGRGGQHFFVSFNPENLNKVPTLIPGELLVQSSDTAFISLDIKNNIYMGNDLNHIHINTGNSDSKKTNLITFNFENENHVTQGSRSINGIVKRHQNLFSNAESQLKFENDDYDPYYQIIGMDPSTTSNDLLSGSSKNPPFVEKRQMVYEFRHESNIDNDVNESNKYTINSEKSIFYELPNRRESRADVLSLSLVAPNYLIESIQGTVVDIFGNILNLNRGALPIGKDKSTKLKSSNGIDTQKAFLNIKELERKSIAFHFELNARKDPSPKLSNPAPALDINADNYNAKLQRSRFFFDIDKEGQFKLNIPASSDTGNIPLLLRYENYSTFGSEDNGNPNKLLARKDEDNLDIFVDSFAAPKLSPSKSEAGFNIESPHGSITIKDNNAEAGPIDRISQFVNNNPVHIKHGTAYHDILQTCNTHQNNAFLNYKTGASTAEPDLTHITELTNIVSDTINISGKDANAGGRSGSINLDGFIEMNIGANTVDRQSLWLDTAGGIIGNIGRDKKGRSMVMSMNGDMYLQIGGYGVSGDSRFSSLGQDGLWNGTLDIRVFTSGYTSIIRVDSQGITIMTPGRLALHSGQGTTLSSDGDIKIDCENFIAQGRLVLKEGGPGGNTSV